MHQVYSPRAGLLLGLLAVAGCQQPQDAPKPQPLTVNVDYPLQREIVEWNEFTGRLEAVDFVEVRARVGGELVEANFAEGQLVEKDKVLMVVDRRPFLAEVSQADAAIKEAEARVKQAQAQLTQVTAQKETAISRLNLAKGDFDRIDALRKKGSVSLSEFERARNEYLTAQAGADVADAAIAGANAAIATAEAAKETAAAQKKTADLNLEFTEIKAPVAGLISRRYVTKGNLISGGTAQSTLLTTIVSVDPIYFVFDASEQQVLRFRRQIQQGSQRSARDVQHPAYLALADETGFPHVGYVDFVDNRFDTNTATLTVRARFDNPSGILTPGLFGQARVAATPRYPAILVPDEIISVDQSESFVYVVDKENKVQRRVVETGTLALGLRVIRSGLSTSDRVVIDGLQKLQRVRLNEDVVQAVEVKDGEPGAIVATESALDQYDSTPREVEPLETEQPEVE